MSRKSSIEWCDATWNPVTGCTKVSQGCKHCYAEVMTKRLVAMGQEKYQHGFNQVVTHPSTLDHPRKWRKPQIIFVNSMSDLFHKDVPTEFIHNVFEVMNDCPRHTFLILTKRPERVVQLSEELNWAKNIWMGTSVEDNTVVHRIDELLLIDAHIRFLSIEPLLEPILNLSLQGIHWVILGGESGKKVRPMPVEWVREIRDLCIDEDVPFFFKQWGGVNKKKAGRLLDGREWLERPVVKAEKTKERIADDLGRFIEYPFVDQDIKD